MDAAAITLVLTNAILLAGGGWLLARRFSRQRVPSGNVVLWVCVLVGVYLAECVAFSASMATNILGFGLAAVWGLVFRRRFSSSVFRESVKLSLALSVFTCLPALSFMSVLVPLTWAGWSLLTAADGYRMGIPEFVPWPFCTLLGFFLTVSLSALVLKTAITTAIIAWPRDSSMTQRGALTDDTEQDPSCL